MSQTAGRISRNPLFYYLAITVIVLVVLLLLFIILELIGIPLFTDPTRWLSLPSAPAAFLIIALLVADVLVPVPSSLVMVTSGALFGFAAGSALSLAGSLGAAMLGYALGRFSLAQFILNRLGEAERLRAERVIAKWGTIAVIVSRPLPLIADTVAIVSGAARIPASSFFVSALLGTLPAALIYGFAGAYIRSFESFLVGFAAVIALAGLSFLAGRAKSNGRS